MLVEQFLAHLELFENYSPHTIESYRHNLHFFVRSAEVSDLHQLTQSCVEQWLYAGRVTRKWRATTYRGYWKRLN